MDLILDEKYKMLQSQSRDFLERECPASHLRACESGESGYSRELYLKMAGMGWLGLGIPEEWGGIGGDVVDLTVLYQEMGRVLLPGPHFISTIVCGQLLLQCASDEQKKALLPGIADGKLVTTLAWQEIDAGYSAASVKLAARLEGDHYVLEGTKLFVPYANVADYIVCVTRTRQTENPEDGITLFLVKSQSLGLTCMPLVTLGGDKESELSFAQVKVPADQVIGQFHGGWRPLMEALDKATVVQCAQLVGGAEKAMELAVDYAKTRVQYDRPIGSFQAIQHKCADMALMVNASRYITYEAACKVRDGEVSCAQVPMAKAYAANACRMVTKEAHQIFGGAGYTTEHPLNFYYRQAKALELQLGDVNHHLGQVAQRIGL